MEGNSPFLALLQSLKSPDNDLRRQAEEEYFKCIEANLTQVCENFMNILNTPDLAQFWKTSIVLLGRCLSTQKNQIKDICSIDFVQRLTESMLQFLQNPSYSAEIKASMTECLITLIKINFNLEMLQILQQMVVSKDLTVFTSAVDTIVGIINIQNIQPEIINEIVTNTLAAHSESLEESILIPLSRFIFNIFIKFRLEICKQFSPAFIQALQSLSLEYFTKSLCILSNFTNYISDIFEENSHNLIEIIVRTYQNQEFPRGIRVVAFQILVEFGFSSFSSEQFNEILQIVKETISQIEDGVDITSEDYEDNTPRTETELSLYQFFSGAQKIPDFSEIVFWTIQECLQSEIWQYVRAGVVLLNDSYKFLTDNYDNEIIEFMAGYANTDNLILRRQIFLTLEKMISNKPAIATNYGPQLSNIFSNSIAAYASEDVLNAYAIFLKHCDEFSAKVGVLEDLMGLVSIDGISVPSCLSCIAILLPKLRQMELIDDEKTSEVIEFAKQFVNVSVSSSLTVYSLSILISVISSLDKELIAQILDTLTSVSLDELNPSDFMMFNESIKSIFYYEDDPEILSHIFAATSNHALSTLSVTNYPLDEDISAYDGVKTYYPRSQNSIAVVPSADLDRFICSLETVTFAINLCPSFPLDLAFQIVQNAFNYQFIPEIAENACEIATFIIPLLYVNNLYNEIKQIISAIDTLIIDIECLATAAGFVQDFVNGLATKSLFVGENVEFVHNFIISCCLRFSNSLEENDPYLEKSFVEVGKLMAACIEGSEESANFFNSHSEEYFPITEDVDENPRRVLIAGSIYAHAALLRASPPQDFIVMLNTSASSTSNDIVLASISSIGRYLISGVLNGISFDEFASTAQSTLQSLDCAEYDDEVEEKDRDKIEAWISLILAFAISQNQALRSDEEAIQAFMSTVDKSSLTNSKIPFMLFLDIFQHCGFELPCDAFVVLTDVSKCYEYISENINEQSQNIILQLRELLTNEANIAVVQETIDSSLCSESVREQIHAIINVEE